ncbi:GerAB/ArcD/ProY family transporter [Chryseomicrobium palamuruense]|uniref:GerAB/ArcD/ProY family transporter n=1 Tax=Chryseomicrobium palamuruense TaxID=682973 RepID=A0ABV8UTN2_9BACL
MNAQIETKWNITKVQLFMFLFVLQSGTTFINLQYRVVNAGNQHGWLIFLGVTAIHLLILIAYIKIEKWFKPNRFEVAIFKLYWLFLLFVFLSKVVFVSQLWVFQETPSWVILLMIGIVFVYALTAQAAVPLNLPILLAPFFVILIGTLFLSWKELNWLNLLPLSGLTGKETFDAGFQSLSAFNGMEALLFLQPFLNQTNKIRVREVVIFKVIFGLFLTMTIVFTLLLFSLQEIKVVPFALMYLLKSQEVTFIERLDLIFMCLWISWSIVSIILYGFLIFRTTSVKIPTIRGLSLKIIPIFILASFFLNRFDITELHNGMLFLSLVFTVVFPAFICLREKVMKRA